MDVTEKDRHDLFTQVEAAWGTPQAETLMRMIATRDDLVTKTYLDQRLDQQLEGIREQMATKEWVREQFSIHTRMFVTWLLAGLAAQTAVIAILISIG